MEIAKGLAKIAFVLETNVTRALISPFAAFLKARLTFSGVFDALRLPRIAAACFSCAFQLYFESHSSEPLLCHV